MRRYVFLALAIVLNSIGHSMTIVTNLGSMPWPASIVNIMHMMGWNMTETIFTEGLGINVFSSVQYFNATLCELMALVGNRYDEHFPALRF